MAGATPFARALSTVSDSLSFAKAAWAEKKDCDHIDTDNSSEFFRIWLGCALYAACLTTAITVPYLLCSDRRDAKFDDKKDVLQRISSRHEGDGETGSWKYNKGRSHAVISAAIDFPAAREHLKKTSPLDKNGKWRRVWGTKVSEMSEVGGIGMELYFRLLRVLGLCFAYKTIFSMPVLVFAVQGDFVPDFGNRFAMTTIGNLGNLAQGIQQADRLVVVGCQGQELSKLTPYFGWLDFIGTLMFTCYIIYFRFRVLPRMAKVDDAENITCRDFAVMIENLPPEIPEQKTYEQQLADFLLGRLREFRAMDKQSKRVSVSRSDPEICEIELVRDYEEKLSHVKYYNELVEQKRIGEEKGEEVMMSKYLCCGKRPIQYFIDAQEAFLKKELKPPEELPVVRAYVILHVPADRERLITHYRFSRYFFTRCCMRRENRFHDTALRVSRAPEPTNIIWENQDVSSKKRAVLRAVIFVVWVVVFLLAILAVFATQKAAQGAAGQAATQVIGNDPTCDSGTGRGSDDYQCSATVALQWTKAMAMNFTNSDQIECFCTTQGYSEIVQDKELWNDICKDWLIDASSTVALSTASSLLTVIINSVLLAVVFAMVQRERHPSVSALNSSMMFKITWSQFGNLGLIIFLLHWYWQPFDWIFNGSYADFERGWYATVGSTLVLNMLLNAITNPLIYLIFWWLAVIGRCRCCTRKIKHQADLLKCYENPEFDLAARYAAILVTVLVTLTYSGGLPMMNFWAFLYFFFTFWTDKWVLLHGSKRPPAYDTQMPKECTQWLLLSLPIHTFTAMFMFSHTCTFPSDPVGGTLNSLAEQGRAQAELSEDNNAISERIARESSWMFFTLGCFLLSGVVLWLISWILSETIGHCCTACLELICPTRHQTLPETEEELTWAKAYHHVERVRPPASYRMTRAPGGATLRASCLNNARDGQPMQPTEEPPLRAEDVQETAAEHSGQSPATNVESIP